MGPLSGRLVQPAENLIHPGLIRHRPTGSGHTLSGISSTRASYGTDLQAVGTHCRESHPPGPHTTQAYRQWAHTDGNLIHTGLIRHRPTGSGHTLSGISSTRASYGTDLQAVGTHCRESHPHGPHMAQTYKQWAHTVGNLIHPGLIRHRPTGSEHTLTGISSTRASYGTDLQAVTTH